MKRGVNVVLTGARALLRAHQAAKGDRLFHHRLLIKAAKRRPEKVRADCIRQRFGLRVHACRDLGDEMYFQSITDKGVTIDAGSIRRVGKVEPTSNVTSQPVVPQAKPSPTQPGPTKTSRAKNRVLSQAQAFR